MGPIVSVSPPAGIDVYLGPVYKRDRGEDLLRLSGEGYSYEKTSQKPMTTN